MKYGTIYCRQIQLEQVTDNMEVKENYNAFKGNSKIGIKTGVQKPKPLKSSTETKLQLQTVRQEELKGTQMSIICLNIFATY